MKFISLLLLILLSSSFVYGQKNAAWTKDFKHFQLALKKNEIAKVKAYVSWPLKSEKNGIWEVVLGRDQNKKQPFSEEDFDTYFDKIFPDLINKSFQEIPIDLLLKKGNFTSKKIQDAYNYAYVNAILQIEKQLLKIEIITFNPLVFDGQIDEEEEPDQIIFTYFFKIDNSKKVLLSNISKTFEIN